MSAPSAATVGLPPGYLALREVPASGSAAPAPFEGRERFAAYVAHELRTPIALQRTLVEVTLADPRADRAALREMGERVIAGCEHQQALIEALLDLACSRFGPTRQEPVDLAVIAEEALRAHDLREVSNIVALEPAGTTGDPDLVARLAVNLVSNAIRHNVPADGLIEVATGIAFGRAVLSVANTGPSIPAEELTRLFRPFQRLDSHPRSSAEGVGLGLAIVQEIANAHRAFVTARPRVGGGLDVHVSFPASMAGADAVGPHDHRSSPGER